MVRMLLVATAFAVVVATLGTDPLAAAEPGTAAVEGTVTEWGTGLPIPGVTVSVGSYTAVTDSNGDYRVEDISTMLQYRVHFDHPDDTYADMYYPGVVDWSDAPYVPLTADETTTGIDTGLQPKGSLIGRIRDDDTGLPVAGICGEAYNNATTTGQTGVSDAQGWLSINYGGSEYEETRVLLTDCNDLGYADEWFEDLPSLGFTHGDHVYQSDGIGPVVGRFDVLVGAPGSIEGTVRDAIGDPIPGVCVDVNGQFQTVTDGGGNYSIGALTAYSGYDINYRDCGWPIQFASGSIMDVSVASGAATMLPIVMDSTASVSGTVTNRSGQPVEGLCISVPTVADWKPPSGDTTTDSLGRYSIEVGDAAEHWVVLNGCHYFHDDRYATQWFDGAEEFADATELGLSPGEVRTGIDFEIDAMAAVSGTLTRTDGGPAADACARAATVPDGWPAYNATIDSGGNYLIDNVPPGTYTVWFGCGYRAEYYDDVPTVEEAEQFTLGYNESITLDAVLEPIGSLFGQVLPSEGSIGEACVSLTDLDGNPVQAMDAGVDEPLYGFSEIALGDYLIYVEDCDITSPTFKPLWWRSAETRSAAEVRTIEQRQYSEVDLWVDPYPSTLTSVSGTVEKNGIDWDACITAYDEDLTSIGTTTASGGTYSIADIELFGPQAAVYVKAKDCSGNDEAWYGGATQAEAAAIAYGAGIQFTDINISVGEALALEVTVSDLVSNPLSGICVDVSGPAELSGVTGADGVALFEPVEPGTYNVVAGVTGEGCRSGYTADDAVVSVAASEAVAIALGLETAEFGDSTTSIFSADIQWLAAAGITRGCNPPVNDEFCPSDLVTRGQMAAFLVRALGLSDRGSVAFVDDDGSLFEADIERLATAGITRGCNPPVNDRFCPDDPVTRGQMAAFLRRALAG